MLPNIKQLQLATLCVLIVALCTTSSQSVSNGTEPSGVASNATTSAPVSSRASPPSSAQAQPPQQVLLDCRPGEQRHFHYESSTKLWSQMVVDKQAGAATAESQRQQVHLRAHIRLRCMDVPSNGTLKYLVEVMSLMPAFGHGGGQATRNGSLLVAARFAAAAHAANQSTAGGARAEPLLEELGEAAVRVQRSMSGWLSKTWSSVRDFFVGMFTSSERSSVGRDQALADSGLDISAACRAAKAGEPGGFGALPIDESVFDDLGSDNQAPKYYIGASTDQGAPLTTMDELPVQMLATSMAASGGEATPEVDEFVAFFDDPRPSASSRRDKRATSTTTSSGKPAADFDKLIRIPFVFVQARTGKIVELRFAAEDSDVAVRNFKRHVCDLFSTNLGAPKSQLSEQTPVGQHTAKYVVDGSPDARVIRQQAATDEQVVRALALMDANSPADSGIELVPGDEARDQVASATTPSTSSALPNSTRTLPPTGGASAPVTSVLRSINSTSGLGALINAQQHQRPVGGNQGHSHTRTNSIQADKVRVSVQQVQQISDGRMIGSAGQLAVSLVPPGLLEASLTKGAGGRRGKREAAAAAEDELASELANMLQVSTAFSVQLVAPSQAGKFQDGSQQQASERAKSARLQTLRPRRERRDTLKRASKRGRQQMAPRVLAGHHAPSSSSSMQRLMQPSNGNSAAMNMAAMAAASAAANAAVSAAVSAAVAARPKARRLPSKDMIMRAPSDSRELVSEWRKVERALDMSPSSLVAESATAIGASAPTAGAHAHLAAATELRLELLRDQIQQRLNEDFVRNRMQSLAMAQLRAAREALNDDQQLDARADRQRAPAARGAGELGASLTRLVLDLGPVARRGSKNAAASTASAAIEEALQLEDTLMVAAAAAKAHRKSSNQLHDGDDDAQSDANRAARHQLRANSIGKLLRDTVRIDTLGQECKSALVAYDQAITKWLSRRGVSGSPTDTDDSQQQDNTNRLRKQSASAERRLARCRQVLGMMVRANDHKAAELVVGLWDECNKRLLAKVRQEELGFGPAGREFRAVRHQFLELLAWMPRPHDALIEALLERMHLGTHTAVVDKLAGGSTWHVSTATTPQTDFVYVKPVTRLDAEQRHQHYNKSLLREADDYNNNDAMGALIGITAQLAGASSLAPSYAKRQQVLAKLLSVLACAPNGTTSGTGGHLPAAPASGSGSCCANAAPFAGPHADVLEALASFQTDEPMLVARVVAWSRHCLPLGESVARNSSSAGVSAPQLAPISDQLGMGVAHALAGQLAHSQAAQRHLADMLRAPAARVSCLVKSEIGQLAMDEMARQDTSMSTNSTTSSNSALELALAKLLAGADARERKCLGLVADAWADMMATRAPLELQATVANSTNNITGALESRNKREIRNDDNFWDVAVCRRWHTGSVANQSSAATNNTLISNNMNELTGNEHDLDRLDDTRGDSSSAAASAVRRRHKCYAHKSLGPQYAQARVSAEVVNDLVGARDENKFLARFKLAMRMLGQQMDIGRMLVWHERRTTRAHVQVLGKRLWDTGAHYATINGGHCHQAGPPRHVAYVPLVDVNMWLVRMTLGLRFSAEMGVFSSCQDAAAAAAGATGSDAPAHAPLPPLDGGIPSPDNGLDVGTSSDSGHNGETTTGSGAKAARARMSGRLMAARAPSGAGGARALSLVADELELQPNFMLRAAGESAAKFVVARAGLTLATNYGYRGHIRVSRQPRSCMSIESAHSPINVTMSSWFQLWQSECHYWGSRQRAEPQATRWRLPERGQTVWLENECLIGDNSNNNNAPAGAGSGYEQIATQTNTTNMTTTSTTSTTTSTSTSTMAPPATSSSG